jgi:hypothetical protein
LVFMSYFDMRFRPAEPDDALSVGRVHGRSWRWPTERSFLMTTSLNFAPKIGHERMISGALPRVTAFSDLDFEMRFCGS